MSISGDVSLNLVAEGRLDYVFGNCAFNDERFELRRSGQEIPLRPKAIDLLSILLSNPGRVISKEELLDRVWPGVVVGEDSLTQCVHEIRTAIGPGDANLLKTVRGRGYMLDAEVDLAGARTGRRMRPRFIPAVAVGLAAVVAIGALGPWASLDGAPGDAGALDQQTILVTGTTMLGQGFEYPAGKPKIASAMTTLPPGFVGDWHVNTSPTFVYILEGDVEVEYAGGQIFRVTAGEAFVEAVDEPHKARVLGSDPVRFLFLDMGVAGKVTREFADGADAQSQR